MFYGRIKHAIWKLNVHEREREREKKVNSIGQNT